MSASKPRTDDLKVRGPSQARWNTTLMPAFGREGRQDNQEFGYPQLHVEFEDKLVYVRPSLK